MLKYVIGALIGGFLGYFVLHRVIGCSSGACPITANPYISTLYGLVLGVLAAALIPWPAQTAAPSGTASATVATQSAAVYQKITPEEAKSRMDSGEALTLVDVRTLEEYQAGHLPRAILIPNETIGSAMPQELPDLDAVIFVYCRSGNRSAQAAKKLIAMGYTHVYDLGGIIDWPYETTA